MYYYPLPMHSMWEGYCSFVSYKRLVVLVTDDYIELLDFHMVKGMPMHASIHTVLYLLVVKPSSLWSIFEKQS